MAIVKAGQSKSLMFQVIKKYSYIYFMNPICSIRINCFCQSLQWWLFFYVTLAGFTFSIIYKYEIYKTASVNIVILFYNLLCNIEVRQNQIKKRTLAKCDLIPFAEVNCGDKLARLLFRLDTDKQRVKWNFGCVIWIVCIVVIQQKIGKLQLRRAVSTALRIRAESVRFFTRLVAAPRWQLNDDEFQWIASDTSSSCERGRVEMDFLRCYIGGPSVCSVQN